MAFIRRSELPKAKIDVLMQPVNKFLKIEAAGGIVLFAATVIALIAANSPIADQYFAIWKTEVGFRIGGFEMFHSLKHWISDGLMVIFFFVIGLEIKREVIYGELGDIRKASLPIAAALGGMFVPVLIYFALQGGSRGSQAWGVPMATDIAFVVGCLAVLGSRVPAILRIMLLSIAIVDDIGAILVIAIAYTKNLSTTELFMAFGGIAFTYVLARIGVRNFLAYILVGTFIWVCFHESGVHATIAGVILGIMTPADNRLSEKAFDNVLEQSQQFLKEEEWKQGKKRGKAIRKFQRVTREIISPLEYLEDNLHPWTSFFIMPLFALANAGVVIRQEGFTDPVAISIVIALVVGKLTGILLFSWIAVKTITKKLPEGIDWWIMAGAASLAGIGFTMALFIASLAVEGTLLDNTKVGIIIGSVIAGAIGMIILILRLPSKAVQTTQDV
jgi:NhaA family Na+:H+ antiporter